MKKIGHFLKNTFSKIGSLNIYIKTFIAGFIIILITYILNHVAPFGDRSLLCVDFYHQYGPMLAEFYDRVHNISNFTYSFSMGMGLPFFRNFLNYMSSPFNIILFFFRRTDLIMSYGVVIGLKAIMAAVTMVYFLSKKFKSQELYFIPLGLIYAFGAYFTAYYWNLMWLDGLVFLPLIVLGIEYIVDEGKWKFYTIFLAIMLLANYFIGYMICIFAVIYFLLYLILQTHISFKKGERWKSIKESCSFMFKRCLKFGTASLIAGLLGAFLLVPMAMSLKSISATGSEMPTSQYYDFEVIDYLKGHLTGVDVTVFASDEITNPNISCGILSIALLLAFIFNRKISFKIKLIYGLMLGFFIFAFFNPQLDFILQAFHVPNDLPYRYSFIYSFILVLIGAYSIHNFKKIEFPIVLVGYLFLMALLFAISEDNWHDLSTNLIYINMILLTLYFMFYIACHYLENKFHAFYYGLILVAMIDAGVMLNNNWDITQNLPGFYEDYNATEELLKFVKDQDTDKFYRIENTSMMTLNDGSWYNYYGMTTFSSMAYESLAKLQHRLGMPGNNINSYYYVQPTPIYDLMFDIKYFIGERNDFNRYEEIYVGEEKANRFLYDISLGFATNFDLLNWNYETDNPFQIQNDFMKLASGIGPILNPMELNRKEELWTDGNRAVMRYYYSNNYDNAYLYARDYTVDFIIIGDCLYYNNKDYEELFNQVDESYGLSYSYVEDYDEEKIINIYSQDEELEIIVGYNNYFTIGYLLYQMDHDTWNKAYVELYAGKLDITSFTESKIKGNINVKPNQIVYTSIPYDEGWHAYVDGVEQKKYKIGDALLGFDSPDGTHEVVLQYKVPYMLPAFMVSAITLGIIVIDHFKGKQIREFIKNKLPKKKEEKPKVEKKTTNKKKKRK